jgi:hypothetical protein
VKKVKNLIVKAAKAYFKALGEAYSQNAIRYV